MVVQFLTGAEKTFVTSRNGPAIATNLVAFVRSQARVEDYKDFPSSFMKNKIYLAFLQPLSSHNFAKNVTLLKAYIQNSMHNVFILEHCL